jgi:hypothetical protein
MRIKYSCPWWAQITTTGSPVKVWFSVNELSSGKRDGGREGGTA